jgi:hypothetical protein
MHESYHPYMDFIEGILLRNDLINFKSSDIYRAILEHVSKEQGLEYYSLIKNEFQLSDETIYAYCQLNDSVGNPVLQEFPFGKSSPTSLRYVYHSNLILKYIDSLGKTSVKIVEIGAGYGGLYLAIQFFAKNYKTQILQYSIIDLVPAWKLQEKYLTEQNMCKNITFHDADTYGANIEGNDNFLIAAYSFSEIHESLQIRYKKIFFPKVDHGFILWNIEPIQHVPFDCKVETERPLTGPHNRFLYF